MYSVSPASIIDVWWTHPVKNTDILETIHVNLLCQQKKSSFLCSIFTSVLHFDSLEKLVAYLAKAKYGVIKSDETHRGSFLDSCPEVGEIPLKAFGNFSWGCGLQVTYLQPSFM